MELTSLFGVRTDLQNDEFVGKLNVVVPLTRSELWESTWLKLNLATDGDCLVMGRESNAKSVKDKQPEDIGCSSRWYRGVRSSFGQSWKMASKVKTGLFIVVQRREITAERSLEGALMLVEPVIERLMCWLNLEWVGTTTHVQSLDSGAHTGWVFCGQVVREEHFLQEISCGCTREDFPIWVHRKPEIECLELS